MKSIILKSVFFITLTAGILSGCVNSDDYENPDLTCVDPNLTPTKTVQEIIALATAVVPSSKPTLYTADDIIEAYVTSSDEKGNFYKSISFQTIPTDGSAPVGFSVPINVGATFAEGFTPGKLVYIKLNGLYTAIVDNALQIGGLYYSSPTAAAEIGRISEQEYKNFLFPSCSKVTEDSFVRTMSIAQAIPAAPNQNINLNTLIELENVQFAESSLGRTYYDVDSGGGATNHYITATSGGTPLILRISSFAPFSGKQIPTGSGKIRGVLTKYGSDFQFMIRYESDIMLTEPRVDVNPPIVGNAIQYLGSFTENFESYTAGSATTGQAIFPKYINDPVIGVRLWRVRSASGTKYIEMSSFGTNPAPEKNRTLFIVPVDMTAANTLAFKTKASFYNGNTLKVYYSTDYTPGADINTATLVNITSNFTISDGSSTSFISSGTYNIPAGVTGNGYFIFEYKGSGIDPKITTNMDIDDIVVN